MEGGHVGALDQAERHHAERGEDVVLQRAAVDAGGVGVAVLRHVGAHVALGEVGDGGAGAGREHGGLLAPLDAVDDAGGAEPGLCRGDLAVGAEGDAAGPAACAGLHDVDLAARGIDAHAEAGQLAVPDDDVALAGAQRVHRAPRENKRATTRHHRRPSSRERAAASPRNAPQSRPRGRKNGRFAPVKRREQAASLIPIVLKGLSGSGRRA